MSSPEKLRFTRRIRSWPDGMSLCHTVILLLLHLSPSQHGAIATHANAAAFCEAHTSMQATTALAKLKCMYATDASGSAHVKSAPALHELLRPDRTALRSQAIDDKKPIAGPFALFVAHRLTGLQWHAVS